MKTRFLNFSLLIIVSGVGLGCGEAVPERIPVFPVAGSVRHGGQPASNVIIQFHPTTPKAAPAGGLEVATIATETDEQGRYTLSTYEDSDGAPAGDYIVTVRPGGLLAIEDGDGQPRRPPEALSTYSEQSTTPLKASIKPGENRFDYELN